MNKDLAKYKLGCWQVAALESIRDKKVCCELKILSKIRGTATNWNRKYKRNLYKAVIAHNKGWAKNSPIDPKYEIVLTECGYHLVERAP